MPSCRHPKPEGAPACSVCIQVQRIVRQVERAQKRLNEGKPLGTLGERIANGNI
jgi:hypothetical protein